MVRLAMRLCYDRDADTQDTKRVTQGPTPSMPFARAPSIESDTGGVSTDGSATLPSARTLMTAKSLCIWRDPDPQPAPLCPELVVPAGTSFACCIPDNLQQ